ERTLRAFRRVSLEEAGASHELEYVDYRWAEDGSLVLRARLAAEDGTVVVQALDAARERVWERRRSERRSPDAPPSFEPPRSAQVEALVALAQTAQPALVDDHGQTGRARLVVHVDAAALTSDGGGRCELDQGLVIAPETARRLGCDAEQVAVIERDGLPVSVGRSRRTVPPSLRRLLEARDSGGCRRPGCDRDSHLAPPPPPHRAPARLSHPPPRPAPEGGHTIEDAPPEAGGLRSRTRHGVLHPDVPCRPPPGQLDALIQQNKRAGLRIDARTNRNGHQEPMNLENA